MKLFEVERLDEEYYYFRSEMGLDVFYLPKKNYDRQYAIFASRFGSVDNEFIPIGEEDYLRLPDGVAHFLEHKLFAEKDKNIFDEFSRLGASANAFTGFDQTAYVFSSTSNFYESLETLISFVQRPYFIEENIEKEKGIIEQEIKMYDDDPNWRVFFNAMDAVYHEHPVKYDIAGTVDSIQQINEDILYRTYNTFYHPENMVLFIVGDLDSQEIRDTVDRVERKDYKVLGPIKRRMVDEPEEIRERLVEDYMDTANPSFYMAYKDDLKVLTGQEELKRDLISNLILDMLFGSSSEFYNKLYEEGLIHGIGAYYTAKNNYGHSLIGGEADDPKKVFDRIVDYMSRPAKEILREEDFTRLKNDEIGSFIMGFDSIEFIANTGVEMHFSNFSIFDYLDLVESIEYEDIIERFEEQFKEDKLVLSIVYPKE